MIKVYNLNIPSDTKIGEVVSFTLDSSKIYVLNITKNDIVYIKSEEDFIEGWNSQKTIFYTRKDVYDDVNQFKIISSKYNGKLVEGEFQFFSRIDGSPVLEFDINQMERKRNEKINMIIS